MPAVSIVLPTCGRPTLWTRAVPSVQAQTESDWELLVIDNSAHGLPPAPGPIQRDPRVRLLRAPQARNAAGARNVGLAAATSEWVTFLDDDDAYRPEKLGRQQRLATETRSPLVLCGARFHLRGRTRLRYASAAVMVDDDLLTAAGLGTPFLFHRRSERRFDESLFAGEDHHYAHGLLRDWRLTSVPVVPEPLVDVYQDNSDEARTNLRGLAGWRAARRIWWEFGRQYSPNARRLFALRARIARAKLDGDTRRVLALVPALLRTGGAAELRFAVNAVLVSRGGGRGRWVT